MTILYRLIKMYILLYICYAAQHEKPTQIVTNTPQLHLNFALHLI